MIVVDTSALVAIILTEPEAEQYISAIEGASAIVISAVSVFEAETVLAGRRDDRVARRVRQLIDGWSIRIQPFDDAQAGLASAAYARFGKGRHPARLNMGDCAAYALARSLDAPLLYKGEDFARTDVASALIPG
ncbi:type II toxin-antitoxin system VapC family toxin [Brevundimonas sp. UBA7534]|uniref:type II toxin-antitoxin system VapC family toxin n=1 Tax=Brevundimonas sp. UBA7534 TaxID=1946138 RepID=UPI0025C04F45|nr:type II toxin-antitoxin system VapC family toxin [Brevundimonas sp. UBA7534]